MIDADRNAGACQRIPGDVKGTYADFKAIWLGHSFQLKNSIDGGIPCFIS